MPPQAAGPAPIEALPPEMARYYQALKSARAELAKVKTWMDDLFLGIGLDAILGMVPFFGDFAGVGMKIRQGLVARKVRAPGRLQFTLLAMTAIDLGLAFLPMAGSVLDFLFRTHAWSSDMLTKHIDAQMAALEEGARQGVGEARLRMMLEEAKAA